MRLALVTLCLNEMEWLPRLYEQHRSWPGMVGWVFVEGADAVYRERNPHMVKDGLSVDGTTEFLRDCGATHIPIGEFRASDPEQSKCIARNAYLKELERLRPTHFLVLDGDEFYSKHDQDLVTRTMAGSGALAFIFHQRHIWRPMTIADQPLMRYEVTGGYWKVPHTRGWSWESGLRYVRNHNWPEDRLGYRTRSTLRTDRLRNGPQCVHMGYAAQCSVRAAKHRYYEARGEDRSRAMYVECRKAFERWRPGARLPHNARISGYNGPVPECFR